MKSDLGRLESRISNRHFPFRPPAPGSVLGLKCPIRDYRFSIQDLRNRRNPSPLGSSLTTGSHHATTVPLRSSTSPSRPRESALVMSHSLGIQLGRLMCATSIKQTAASIATILTKRRARWWTHGPESALWARLLHVTASSLFPWLQSFLIGCCVWTSLSSFILSAMVTCD